MTEHTTGTGKDWLPAPTSTTSAEPGPQRMTSERAFRQAYLGLRAMAAITAIITGERLASSGEYVARAVGIAGLGSGLFLIERAAGLG